MSLSHWAGTVTSQNQPGRLGYDSDTLRDSETLAVRRNHSNRHVTGTVGQPSGLRQTRPVTDRHAAGPGPDLAAGG